MMTVELHCWECGKQAFCLFCETRRQAGSQQNEQKINIVWLRIYNIPIKTKCSIVVL